MPPCSSCAYLDDWEKSVKQRKGFTDAEKKTMLLSEETQLGLRITGVCVCVCVCVCGCGCV